MRYEIRVWYLDEEEETVIKCETKNQIIDNLVELAYSNVVEDVLVIDTVKEGRI